jgi:cold shock protein
VARGIVWEWNAPEGRGVIDSDVTPGDCLVRFMNVALSGYRPSGK